MKPLFKKMNDKTKSPRLKTIALVLVLSLLFQIVAPTAAYALTSGPSQPEIAQFQQAGVTDMVDMFTGDFGYNIPLLELPGPNGGYPFNLSYQSGVTMEQEASWVGLGWNVNAGAIVRNMRSLPDEFNGKDDAIERKMDRKANETYGAGVAVSVKFAGADFKKLGSNAVTMSVGMRVYENTYNGIGYGIDLGTSFAQDQKGKLNAGVGFNLSLDSQEGVGANANVSLSKETEKSDLSKSQTKSASLGIGFHSSGGLNGAISGSIRRENRGTQEVTTKEKDAQGNFIKKLIITGKKISSTGGSSPISFASASHMPSMGFEMKSLNFTGSVSIGGGINGTFTNFSVNGFYSLSKLLRNEESLPAYGYLHLQDQKEGNAMVDFNREKDGPVYKGSGNLASPSLTYDYYLINGQGTGGMFRPYRQDYGHVHEQERASTGMGGSMGFDVGLPGHYGISGAFNYSESRTGDWKNNNEARQYFNFRKKGYSPNGSPDFRYEGAYFKMAGELAAIPLNELNDIGNEHPVNLVRGGGHSLEAKLNVFNTGALNASSTVGSINTNINLSHDKMRREKRMPRSTAIYAVTNRELMPNAGTSTFNEVLAEYDITVRKLNAHPYNYNNLQIQQYSEIPHARGAYINGQMKYGDHLAGITVQQPDGKRYVYALPAYNNTQVQETFSVPAESVPSSTISFAADGNAPRYKHTAITNEYHERVTIPRYAHSYLLTSVLGDDYVDADHDMHPGPSDGDYGYWVKFNYVKTSDAFPWRTPLAGATYIPGQAGASTDDLGTYTYGTKEIWYLASAETQTHIVIFEMSPRLDGYGPASELNPTVSAAPGLNTANKLCKLDAIKLYSKAELALNKDSEPLQTVHFKYSYRLCESTGNSMAPGKAKLTLDKVYFTHKYDRTGMLSPYEFEYDMENNPDYDIFNNRNDRWGTYRSMDYGGGWANQEFPYTPQFDRTEIQDAAAKADFKEMTDKNASAWHLIGVKLPSGGKIKVEYESDDYAYVQHKKAAQMFRIEGVGDEADNTLFESGDDFWGPEYNPGNSTDVTNSRNARRIYFQLEEPIPATMTSTEIRDKLVADYFDCLLDKAKNTYTKPLHAKVRTNLRGDIDEYISGYYFAELDETTGLPVCGVGDTEVTVDGIQCYKHAYIVLDFIDINGPIRYHPLAVTAWQYMRINLPRVLTASGDFVTGENASNIEHLTRMGSLASWTNTIRSMFTGYRKYCYDKKFADEINLSQSFIRLNTPDGFKYGGGSRVKKIYVEDDPIWGDDKIGQVYDYTTEESPRSTRKISSGVASYEPMIGGEENVLRTAKFTTQAIPFFTNNNLFFEYPINESYYPAPRVGYSRVTVTSLATAEVQKMIADNAAPEDYEGIQTTGKVVHEYYTAKDFPTITGETKMQPYNNPYIIPLPFVGMVQVSKLTATQGYSIQLNDMHGKVKKVNTYASDTEGGYAPTPVNSVSYHYKSVPYTYEGEQVYRLDNKVDVLIDDPQMKAEANDPAEGYDKAKVEKMYLGMEYDFFSDFRHSVDEAGTGGLDFNIDIMGAGAIGFPLPFPWPSFNFSHTSTRLAVTNKIIHCAGIIDSVVATDGQSTVSTKNLVYDKYTGEPLLTTVNNNYDNRIYTYAYPAHMAYENTGPAYENILLEFTTSLIPAPEYGGWTLEKEDISAIPMVFPTGSNTGMGYGFKRPADINNKITYNQLYDYLNEGDEFIVEVYKHDFAGDFYNPVAKRFCILKDKRLGVSYVGCQPERILVFNFPYSAGLFKAGQPVRMLLVRSGKRNLLNLKTGAIKTLMDINGGTDILANSPLYKREMVYQAGSVEPDLFTSLKHELAGFLNGILDCNGRLPVGNYYMDHPRFVDKEGDLKYKNLFGLLKSIRIENNCAGQQDCYNHELTGATPHDGYWSLTCKASCNKLVGGDMYNPIYSCSPSLPTLPSAILAGFTQGGCSSLVDYSCIENAFNSANPCHILEYVEPGTTNHYECTEGICLDCKTPLGVDGTGKNINRGYHLVLQFREPFAANLPGSCITTHCLATAKYMSGGAIMFTRIDSITVESGNIIRFHYGLNPGATTTDYCMDDYEFALPSTHYSIKNVLAASAVELGHSKLNEEHYEKTCIPEQGNATVFSKPTVNPYVTGHKGIWRPVKTYYYSDERYQGEKASSGAHMTSMLDLASDGVFDGEDNDKKFYLFNWNSYLAKKIYGKWLPNETVTALNVNSQSAEARDVLGIYSSVLFDRHNRLPVAVGRNMRLTEMVYENFDNTETIAWTATDDFDDNGIKDHLQVQIIKAPFTGNGALSVKSSTIYVFDPKQFRPAVGKKYLLSLWAGGFNTLFSPAEFDARFGHLMNVKLYFLDKDGNFLLPSSGSIPYILFKTSGKIYEGGGTFWRKIEGTFIAPDLTHRVAIEFGTTGFSNTGNQMYGTMYQMAGNGNVFIDQRACYDDIRICPVDGMMNTYVYDSNNYRLVAEGDENNFPTLYGYAPSGALMVVKKLTEEGIRTLKEIRSNTKRNPKPLPGDTPLPQDE